MCFIQICSLGRRFVVQKMIGISVLYILVVIHPVHTTEFDISVNSSDIKGNLVQFWRSTGFCPPLPHQDAYGFDYGKDMILNLALIGSTPHSGIQQVRIHWLLDLVTLKQLSHGRATYNFTKLDQLIEVLWENGLKPGFEIMGNPSDIFTDFENQTQVYMWKDLIQQLAQHYVDEYGLSFVKTWNFETWNEPDCKDFDSLNMTVQGFLNYYDASWEGLKSVSRQLVLGGPGDGCDKTIARSHYSDAFINHVVSGKNFFENENDVKVDFLSYHRKGAGSSLTIIEQELATANKIFSKYPSLANTPFINDEADPLVGWSKDEWWRADATYAAIVAKIISQHQDIIISNTSINYSLLSNDNGFLSFYPRQFTQRTLMARFQMNNTKHPYTQFIRKPVHAVMSLLALHGERQLRIKAPINPGDDIGVLASYHEPEVTESADSKQIVILIYNSADTARSVRNDSVHCTINLDADFAKHEITIVQYTISNFVGNPYAVWERYGKPDFPTLTLFEEMRSQEGPIVTNRMHRGTRSIRTSFETFTFLPQPGIILVHVCAKSVQQPDRATDVNIYNITIGQVLITWSDGCIVSKCIFRYDVAYSPKSSGSYKIINEGVNSIVTSFVYVPGNDTTSDIAVKGFYRVRAVDYFNRAGEFSLPQKYPK